jgi:hypothetical protein
MGFFDRFKTEKEVWRLCVTLPYPTGISVSDRYGKEEHGSMYFHLFESNKNNRKVQVRTGGISLNSQVKADEFAKNSEFYQVKIYRWLVGRNDPDIPRFADIDAEETVHYLKGTISETI